MRDLMAELKELRLHGIAQALEELAAQEEASTASSKWLLEHLLQQEQANSVVRSVNHQTHKVTFSLSLIGPLYNATTLPQALTFRSCTWSLMGRALARCIGVGSAKYVGPNDKVTVASRPAINV